MKQLREVRLGDIVFLDIETAPVVPMIEEGTDIYEAWKYRMQRKLDKDEDATMEDSFVDEAGIYAEFSRIVCITVGVVKDEVKIVLKTYKDEDEKMLLEKFMSDLNQILRSKPNARICGHSVKGFDIPFIFRRSLVNQVYLSPLIDVGGLKPWEVTALDTKELWRSCGNYSASLVSVCLALGVESPKSDISGADVGRVYWSEGAAGVERIAKYCEKDVVALINVVRVCRYEKQIHLIEVHEPKEPEPEGLIARIARIGEVTPEDEVLVLEKVKGAPIDDKEKMIGILKGALAVSKRTIPQELELKIIKS